MSFKECISQVGLNVGVPSLLLIPPTTLHYSTQLAWAAAQHQTTWPPPPGSGNVSLVEFCKHRKSVLNIELFLLLQIVIQLLALNSEK